MLLFTDTRFRATRKDATMTIPSVLIIDDSDDYRLTVCNLLLDAGYDVWDACCPHDAFLLLHREQFDLIICDLHMPFMTGEHGDEFETSYQVGIKTIHELKGLFPNTPIIGLTNTDQQDLQRIRRTLGDIKAFTKPIRNSELMAIVEGSIEHGPQSMQN